MSETVPVQKLADKIAAIESLLGFLFAHLDHMPNAARTARQEWISEPSLLDDPPKPPPLYNLNCSGHCRTCLAFHSIIGRKPDCPPDELWVREYKALRVRYRIADLERALLDLGSTDMLMAQAVWAAYVEPWPDPKTEPISPATRAERDELALAGLDWLAHHVPGEVCAHAEKPSSRENQIRQLISQGYTWKRVCRELRCSRRDVAVALRVPESAVGV